MPRRIRRFLIFLALAALILALAVLIYVFMPVSTIREVIPVTPTYLVPPAGVP